MGNLEIQVIYCGFHDFIPITKLDLENEGLNLLSSGNNLHGKKK